MPVLRTQAEFSEFQLLHAVERLLELVNADGVVDQLLGKLLPDEGGQVAAHLIGKAQLAVRERARTGKAGGDGAGGAAAARLPPLTAPDLFPM